MAELENAEKKQARVIAISNQKGGVGKTTTTALIGICLAANGYKTLVVDCDSSANLTSYFGARDTGEKKIELPELFEKSINYEDISRIPPEEILYHCDQVDLLGSNIHLAAVEASLMTADQREYILSEILSTLFINNYDYILLDTGPSLGMMLTNALVAATEILIPVQPERFAAEGLGDLFTTIVRIKKRMNRGLKILGIIVTLYQSSCTEHRLYVEDIREAYKEVHVFDEVVPVSFKQRESVTQGKNIYEYSARSGTARAYKKIVREIIEKGTVENG